MASYTTLTNAARLIISIQLESSITFLLQCVWGIEAQNCKIFSSQGLLQGGFNTILGRHCYVRKRCRTPSKEFISPTNNTAYFQLSFLCSSTGKGTAAGLRLIHVRITGVGVGAWHAFVKIWILGTCSKWTCDFSVSEKKSPFIILFWDTEFPQHELFLRNTAILPSSQIISFSHSLLPPPRVLNKFLKVDIIRKHATSPSHSSG